MSRESVLIPPAAWEGVSHDPALDLYDRCFTCGGANVRTLSMAAMCMLPAGRIINAHTFLIPNKAWGYVQCDDCEALHEQIEQTRPWWKRLLTRIGNKRRGDA
jgi:hypothetical protein